MAERRISAAGLVFKGSGFYITDYGKDGKKQQTTAAESTAAKPAEATTGSTSTESKPAPAESKATPAPKKAE